MISRGRILVGAGCFVLSLVVAAVALAGPMPDGPLAAAMSPTGWGLDVGRADEGDVAELLADQIAIKRALRRIQTINGNDLAKEKLRQLLGIESATALSLVDLLSRSEKWWKDEVDGPIERISGNPAASCEEARAALSLLIDRERMRQLLGMSDEGDVFGGKVATKVKTRCREEKLDECNATGRFDQIIEWALSEERQLQLLGGSGGSSDDVWAIDALKECAIYELHYVSTTDIDDAFKLHSVIDGRIPIKFKPGKGGGSLSQIAEGIFEGETESDVNPFLQAVTCAGMGVTIKCGPGFSPLKTAFSGIVSMEMKHREVYLDENGLSKSRVVGDNKLKFKFSPSMLSTVAIITAKDIPPTPIPNLEVGATGFWIAHKKYRTGPLMVTFDQAERGVYPVLFEFTRIGRDSEEDIAGGDTTKFELIHKPKKKPFTKAPTPPRRVVRGKP